MDIVLPAVVALVVGTMAFVRYYRPGAYTMRLLRRQPRTSIAEARGGTRVKLVGRVRILGRPLISPATERPCACYQLAVCVAKDAAVILAGGGDGFDIDPNSVKLVARNDFLLEDDTGRALVVAEGAELALVKDVRLRCDELTPVLASRLAELSGLHLSGSNIRIEEGVLEEGAIVAVVGLCTWEPDPEPTALHSYREFAQRVVVRGSRRQSVHVSNHPKTFAAHAAPPLLPG